MKEALFFEKDRHINFLQWGWRQCFNYLSSLQPSPSLPQLHFFHVFHRGWLLLPGKRMWTCKFWYLSDMDRMKCVVWDFNVLLMEKHGLKHWSLVRWGSVGDVILERTLTLTHLTQALRTPRCSSYSAELVSKLSSFNPTNFWILWAEAVSHLSSLV